MQLHSMCLLKGKFYANCHLKHYEMDPDVLMVIIDHGIAVSMATLQNMPILITTDCGIAISIATLLKNTHSDLQFYSMTNFLRSFCANITIWVYKSYRII